MKLIANVHLERLIGNSKAFGPLSMISHMRTNTVIGRWDTGEASEEPGTSGEIIKRYNRVVLGIKQ